MDRLSAPVLLVKKTNKYIQNCIHVNRRTVPIYSEVLDPLYSPKLVVFLLVFECSKNTKRKAKRCSAAAEFQTHISRTPLARFDMGKVKAQVDWIIPTFFIGADE